MTSEGLIDRAGPVLLGALAPAAALAVDPAGWYPFGPAKWLAVSVLGLAGAAAVLASRPVAVPDLASAVDQPAFVQDVAFGPLGLVAAAWTGDGAAVHLIHSFDGSTLSSVALADHIGGSVSMIGIGVTADAIVVRVGGPPDDDPATLPTQQVLVGTPR
jgi:hypothetical protein